MSNFHEINGKTVWDYYLAKAEFKTQFHTWEWRELMCNSFSWLKPKYLFYENGVDNAIIPFFEYKNKMDSLPMCEYGGPIILNKNFDFNKFFERLKNDYPNYKIKINFHPFIANLVKDKEVLNTDLATYLLRLNKGFQNLFRKEVRRNIRSFDSSLSISKLKTENELKTFYDIYLKTMRKHGALCEPYIFFRNLMYFENAEIFIVSYQNKIIGGSVFLKGDNIVQYYKSAFLEDSLKYKPVYMLLNNRIENSENEGFDFFDFGGTRKGNSLEIFKAGWGGTPLDINRYCYNTDFVVPRESNIARVIWKKLPIKLIQLLSNPLQRCLF